MKYLKWTLMISIIFVLVTFSQVTTSLKVFRCSLCKGKIRNTSCYTKKFYESPEATNKSQLVPPKPSKCSISFSLKPSAKYLGKKNAYAVYSFIYSKSPKAMKPLHFRLTQIIKGSGEYFNVYFPKTYNYWEEDAKFKIKDCRILNRAEEHRIEVSSVPYANTRRRPACVKRKISPDCCLANPKKQLAVCRDFPCPQTYPKNVTTSAGLTEPFVKDTTLTNFKKQKIVIICGCSLLTVLIIIGTVVLITRKRSIKLHRALVLVSTGDTDSKYRDYANQIASELKESKNYEDVFFNDWFLESNEQNIIRVREEILKCTVAILFSSPFGKNSYSELLDRKDLSTWRDTFVIGAYTLLNQTYIPFQKRTKIIVVYASDVDNDVDKHVHNDFKTCKSAQCYNILNSSDFDLLDQVLYKIKKVRRENRLAGNRLLATYSLLNSREGIFTANDYKKM